MLIQSLKQILSRLLQHRTTVNHVYVPLVGCGIVPLSLGVAQPAQNRSTPCLAMSVWCRSYH